MKPEIHAPELENLLRSLAPAAVSPDLRTRVEEELRLDMSWLSQTVKKPRAVRWLAPVCLVASLMPAASAGQSEAQAAASMPTCRIAPPSIRRWRMAARIRSRGPASRFTAPEPFWLSTITVSNKSPRPMVVPI